MRVGIDAHFVGVRHGGNERYFENILRHLPGLARPEDSFYAFSYRLAARRSLGAEGLTHLPLRAASVYWQRAVELPRYARRLGLDVLHVPSNFVPTFKAKKVVTIHDVAFLDLPRAYAPLELARMVSLTRFAARHADHVLTVSEFSKRSIIEHYGIAADRITVTPNAADAQVFRRLAPDATAAARRRLHLEADYLLFVGFLQPRKNLLTLLRAYELLRSRRRADLHLVLVGRRGWRSGDVFRYVDERGLRGVVHHLGAVDVGTLVELYNGAAAFVFPSLSEGFGVPILEAMGCGCPVVCSSAAAMPEVFGDAALAFDPREPEELAVQLERVLSDDALRCDLVRRGIANRDRYSWARTAAIIASVYRAL